MLNRFDQFALNQADVANLNLGKVNHQINIANNKIDINGVVNALKDGRIGGDVYFFSDKGIAVGRTGVINVGRLTLGTNAAAGAALFGDTGFFGLSLPERAAKLKDGAADGEKISISGKINAQDSILIAADNDVTLDSTALLRTGGLFLTCLLLLTRMLTEITWRIQKTSSVPRRPASPMTAFSFR